MNKSEINIGEFLKENKAIFSYIYNNMGFRIGVVVAKKGEMKGHNAIGWALFNEVSTSVPAKTITAKDIPAYEKLRDSIKNSLSLASNLGEEGLKTLTSVSLFDVYSALNTFMEALGSNPILIKNESTSAPLCYMPYTYKIVSKEDVFNTIKLALEKANCDSWNYYCPKREGHDLREDIVRVHSRVDMDDKNSSVIVLGDKMPILANILRKAIRKMEYRAWRYFK